MIFLHVFSISYSFDQVGKLMTIRAILHVPLARVLMRRVWWEKGVGGGTLRENIRF